MRSTEAVALYFLIKYKSLLFRPKVGLSFIDHVVGNQPDNEMVPIAEWYVIFVTYDAIHQVAGLTAFRLRLVPFQWIGKMSIGCE